jgi:hypothetical protein
MTLRAAADVPPMWLALAPPPMSNPLAEMTDEEAWNVPFALVPCAPVPYSQAPRRAL